MDSCDYCGRPMPSMTHSDAPWKAFCSDECYKSVIHSVHADFSEGILTIQSDPPMALEFLQPPTYKDTHDFEFRKPAKHQPVSQMDLF